jgi:RNA polymerase sigma-70 factor (ECF subfamily)
LSHFNLTIDEVTFKAACKNKTAAQRKIYNLYATSIYNLAYRMTKSQTDALDISQETFIKVFTKIAQNKSQELLGFWIRKITINTAFTFIKKNAQLITNINFKEKTINSNVNEIVSSL